MVEVDFSITGIIIDRDTLVSVSIVEGEGNGQSRLPWLTLFVYTCVKSVR